MRMHAALFSGGFFANNAFPVCLHGVKREEPNVGILWQDSRMMAFLVQSVAFLHCQE